MRPGLRFAACVACLMAVILAWHVLMGEREGGQASLPTGGDRSEMATVTNDLEMARAGAARQPSSRKSNIYDPANRYEVRNSLDRAPETGEYCIATGRVVDATGRGIGGARIHMNAILRDRSEIGCIVAHGHDSDGFVGIDTWTFATMLETSDLYKNRGDCEWETHTGPEGNFNIYLSGELLSGFRVSIWKGGWVYLTKTSYDLELDLASAKQRGSLQFENLELQRSGSVRLRLVDCRGESWKRKVNMELDSMDSRRGPGSARALVSAAGAHKGREPGVFIFDSVMPGAHALKIKYKFGPQFETWGDYFYESAVVVSAGAETELLVRMPAANQPGDASLLLYADSGGPIPPPENIHITDLQSGAAVACRADYTIEKGEGRAFSVKIDDPRYLPAEKNITFDSWAAYFFLDGAATAALDLGGEGSSPPAGPFQISIQYDEAAAGERLTMKEPAFSLQLPLAACTITISAEGFEDRAIRIENLKAGENRHIPVMLKSAANTGCNISGLVICEDSSTDPGNVSVHLQPVDARGIADSRRGFDAAPDAAGRYQFNAVPNGKYVLFGTLAPERKSEMLTIVVTNGRAPEVPVIEIRSSGILTGRILGRDLPETRSGKGEAGTLSLRANGRAVIRDQQIVQDNYLFTELTPGDYDIYIQPEGADPVYYDCVLVEAGKIIKKDIQLNNLRAAGMQLALAIVYELEDGSRMPAPGVRVALRPENSDGRTMAGAITNGDGIVTFPNSFSGPAICEITAANGVWSATTKIRIAGEPGLLQKENIMLKLVERELTFRAAGGRTVWPDSIGVESPLTGDAEFRALPVAGVGIPIRARLPVGKYRFSVEGFGVTPWTDWDAQLPRIIKLQLGPAPLPPR